MATKEPSLEDLNWYFDNGYLNSKGKDYLIMRTRGKE